MQNKLVLLILSSRRRFLRLSLVFKIVNDINCPDQLKCYLTGRCSVNRDRLEMLFCWIFLVSTKMGQGSFKFRVQLTNLSYFKSELFKYFLRLDNEQRICSVL